MSNLSDLLPAGAGGKQVKFVASGTLPSGQTIALNADGTVSAIGSGTAVSKAIPAAAAQVFTNNVYLAKVAFDPSSPNKFVIAFLAQGELKAVAGSLSGTTATFGTIVSIGSNNNNGIGDSSAVVAFNPNVAGQFVIVFLDLNDGAKGKIRLGTVSSNAITLQSTVIYDAATPGVGDSNSGVAFDPNTSGKLAIVYKSSTGYGKVLVCTISGNTISINSPVQFGLNACNQLNFSFDPNTANKLVIVYQDGRNGDYGTSVIATISGTGVTFGSLYIFESAATIDPSPDYNPTTANHFAIAYKGSGQDGKSRLGTVSGTAISYPATAVTFATTNALSTCLTFDPNTTNKFVISYAESSKLYIVEGTASSTTVSLGTPIEIFSQAVYPPFTRFNPTASSAGQFMTAFSDDATANDPGNIRLGQIAATAKLGNAGFIGISDAAIANSATGSVTVKGGIATLTGGTYAVTVANPGSGNRYYIDGVLQQTLNLREGFTYKFDQSAGSNGGHPLRFSTTANGTHAGGSEYTTGVTTNGVPGNAGAYTQIVVAAGAPTLYYYCSVHSLMGGTANTLTGIVANSNYYVQGDGTLSTTTSSVLAGKALSTTSINLDYTT